jgi:hypothetical protein
MSAEMTNENSNSCVYSVDGAAADSRYTAGAGGYSYAELQAHAASQAYVAANLQHVSDPAALNPWSWQATQQGALYAGRFGGASPVPLPQYHSYNQQRGARSSITTLHLQHAPYYGEYIPLMVSVHVLREDNRLKNLLNRDEVLVNYGSPVPIMTPPEGGGSHARKFPVRAKKELFVFHVPNEMTNEELHELFSRFGKVRNARIALYSDDTSKGYAFVTFHHLSDAVVAVHSLNGYKVSNILRDTSYIMNKS